MNTDVSIIPSLAGPVPTIGFTAGIPASILAVARSAKETLDLDGRMMYIVDVDRGLAELLLENLDPNQRTRSKSLTAEIQADIEAGKWFNTGDPLRLLDTGTLVDGQHRLNAFLRARLSADAVLRDMTIVVMKQRAALDVVDTGKSRTVLDLRKMTGRAEVSSKVIGGILYEMSDYEPRAAQSKLQRNEMIDSHPFLNEVIALAQPRKGIQISSTPVIAAAIRCMRVPGAKDLAFEFFNAALQNRYDLNGQIVPQLKLLTDWLVNNHHNGGGHAIRRETVVRCIRSWNAYRENRTLLRLRYSKRDEIPQAV